MKHASRRVVFLASFAAILAGVGLPAAAQQPPEKERGFRPELVYQFNGFDSVNLFNGNLNMSIPLGQTYPVGAGLSYAFVLRYAGNVWLSVDDCTHGREENTETRCGARYIPHRDNAGLGWSLSFGELKPPGVTSTTGWGDAAPALWRYVTPDGGEHFFFRTLHEPACTSGSTINCEAEVAGVQYTRDGSYLRMKDDGTAAKIIEFPDGQRHRFVNEGTDTEPLWRLQFMYTAGSALDAAGTPQKPFVSFSYPSTTSSNYTVTDSTGRTHTVSFQAHPTFTNYHVVSHISLAAFSGTADYNFTYDGVSPSSTEATKTLLAKPCGISSGENTSVNLLTRVDLPLGEKFVFEYYAPVFTSTGEPGCSAAKQSGTLTKAVLPTGGEIEWTYRDYVLVSDGTETGVHERRVFGPLANGTRDELELRVYSQSSYSPTYARTAVENYIRNSSSAWELDLKIASYFNIDRSTSDFGLPYAPTGAVTTAPNPDGSNKNRYLSTETFDCTGSQCALERATYVKHEMDYVLIDAMNGCSIDNPCARDRNRRVVTESTVYVTDGNRAAYSDYSSFDGLGHYRQTNTGLMLNGVKSSEREVFTHFNSNILGFDGTTWTGSSVGTYTVTADGASGFAMLAPKDPWVLTTYTNAHAIENGEKSEVRACFDPRNAFLYRKRVLSGTSATDLLAVFARDAATGYVASEQYYGGDDPSQSLPDATQNLCTISPPGSSRYRINHTYASGSLSRSQYVNPATNGDLPFPSADFTIEPRTGLPSESRDTAGVKTTYTYDAQARLTKVTPGSADVAVATEAPTSYNYFAATGKDAPARVEIKKGDVETIWFFDPLGRIRREKRRMPDLSWSVRDTERNALGYVTSISELVKLPANVAEFAFVPQQKTQYTDFDAFGRARAITAPDGSTTTFAYTGVREVVRTTHGVATDTGAGSSVAVTEEFDRYGRLSRVRENSTGSDWTETFYGYDSADRLRSVMMQSADGLSQARTFRYDGRGFLFSETHPESGTTSYEYDAKGHVTKRVTPATTLTFQYDAAERLTKVWESDTVLKEFAYDRAGAPRGLGKLDYAIRHNHQPGLGDVQVKETYTYAGVGGRLSSKKTEVSNGPSFEDRYVYDSTGALTSLTYPSCTGCGISLPARVVNHEYAAGGLKKVDGYGTFDYWANGMLKSVQHAGLANTARSVDEHSMDTGSGMARPAKITFSGFCADFAVQTHPAARTVQPDEPAGLTVSVPGAQSYQWYAGEGEASPIAEATDATLTAPVTVTTSYWVRASNGACTVDSRPALLTVAGTCGTPPTASVSGTATVSAGSTTYLTVTLTGTAPWTLGWSDGVVESNIQASPHRRSLTPPASATYTLTSVKDASGCSGSASGEAVITVNDSSSCTLPNMSMSVYNVNDAYSENNVASVAATDGATYSWSISGGTALITDGQGTPAITYSALMCAGTFSLTVTVTTSCSTATKTELITISSPHANIHTGQKTVNASGEAIIYADLTGVPPWDVTWFDGKKEIPKRHWTSPAALLVEPPVTTDYSIKAVTSTEHRCTGQTSGLTTRVIVPCAEPTATLTVDATSIRASDIGTATVSSTTTGLSYSWSITNGTIFTGVDTSSVTFRAGCAAGPAVLKVTVQASCGAIVTREASINVTPLSAAVDGSSEIVQGQTATIDAAIDGVAPWTVVWSDGVVQNNVTSSRAERPASPEVSTTYSVTSVSDSYGCSSSGTGSWVVTVAPPAPSFATAVATGPDRVLVQWAFSGTADEFRIERFDRLAGSPSDYQVVGTAGAADRAFVNVSIPSATAYLYRVLAVKGGVVSAASQPDLATTIVFADDPIVSTSTTVMANQILQLRSAVDAVRALAQLSPGTYTSDVSPGQWITRAAIDDLRTALDPARAALSLPPVAFTDRPLPVRAVIRGVYWTELRGGVK